VTYYYRAVASNEQGQVAIGVEQHLLLAAPVVTSSPSRAPATMVAGVNPNNLPTYGWFEWGPTPAYGQLSSVQLLGNGFDATLWQNLPNATLGATYYYRAAASNAVGLVYGPAQSLIATQPIVMCPGFVSPPSRSHGYGAMDGNVYFWVACDWTVVNTNSWIKINSAINGPMGYGVVSYTLAVNTELSRKGYLTIGGNPYEINQAAGHPVIATHPTNQNIMGGETAAFNVGINGSEPVTYEWQFNQVPLVDGGRISGAKTATLRLTDVLPSQEGYYRVIVGYPGGTTYSSNALLTVGCEFTLSTSSATHASGQVTGSVQLNAGGCPWDIINPNPWVTVLSGIINKGSGTVIYSLTANTTPFARDGKLTIGNKTFTITQAGGSTSDTISLPDAVDSQGIVAWKTVGDWPWFGQSLISHDGTDAAQSGGNNDSTAVTAQATLIGPGMLSFWWKVSSETNKDLLKFFVNGVEQTRISGEKDWHMLSYTFASGVYTSKWTYAKNEHYAGGQDRGWLDEVRFVPGEPACAVTLSQTSAIHGPGLTAGQVNVTAAAGCPWSIISLSPWIVPTADPAQGVLRYQLYGLPTADRTGVILIAGKPFTITQLSGETPFLQYLALTLDQVRFTVEGVQGKLYAVQRSEDLIHWSSIRTNTVPWYFSDSLDRNAPKRFYRTVELP